MIEISMGEFVCKMLNLQLDESLEFFPHESGNAYGVVKVKHFNAGMLLINCYGDSDPLVIALNAGEDADERYSHVLARFKAYCRAKGMTRLYTALRPKAASLCPQVLEMRSRKKSALLSKDALTEQLSQGGYTDRALSKIRDAYTETLGFDPIWRYPFCHEGKLGAVLVPVKEGFLWLPYSIIDIDDDEKYEPENTALLDAKTCEWLIEEMGRHTTPLAAVMRYVADELRTAEALPTIGNHVGVCSPCAV